MNSTMGSRSSKGSQDSDLDSTLSSYRSLNSPSEPNGAKVLYELSQRAQSTPIIPDILNQSLTASDIQLDESQHQPEIANTPQRTHERISQQPPVIYMPQRAPATVVTNIPKAYYIATEFPVGYQQPTPICLPTHNAMQKKSAIYDIFDR